MIDKHLADGNIIRPADQPPLVLVNCLDDRSLAARWLFFLFLSQGKLISPTGQAEHKKKVEYEATYLFDRNHPISKISLYWVTVNGLATPVTP